MFLRSSFSPVSFSQVSFNGAAQPAITAKSGWFRLQLIEAQQRSLDEDERKKREQVQGQEAPRREGEAPAAKPVAAPAVRPKRPRRQRAAEPTVHERVIKPFIFRVVNTEPTIYDQLAEIASLPDTPIQVKVVATNVINLQHERTKRQQRNRRRAAALLLMAA